MLIESFSLLAIDCNQFVIDEKRIYRHVPSDQSYD